MNQAEIDRQSITYIVYHSNSPEEARRKFDKLEGITLKKEFAHSILEEAIKEKFLTIDSQKKAMIAEIDDLEKSL